MSLIILRMKVIHFLNELKFSGAEIMYVDAAPIFRDLGCELIVVNTHPQMGEYSTAFKNAGYKCIHKNIPTTFIKQWKMRKELIRFIKDGKYDVIHIHRNDLRWILSYCAFKAGIKSVYTTHAIFRSHWYSYPLHYLYRWSALNIFECKFQTISDSVDANERNYYHTKTHLVYNWYNNDRFYPAQHEEKVSARHELGIKENALVIISVGGCSKIKRHSEIIKAMVEVVKKQPDAIYIHLGEGPSLEDEKKMVKSLHLENNVLFFGNQKDVRKYLIASDIYTMTSVNEGISLTTIEALACHIPAILYNVPGLRDFNKEKDCSILIPEDYKLLAVNIISLYNNPQKRLELTNNGYELVNSKFNIHTNTQKIFELYKN